jgi:hypothetical protein
MSHEPQTATQPNSSLITLSLRLIQIKKLSYIFVRICFLNKENYNITYNFTYLNYYFK